MTLTTSMPVGYQALIEQFNLTVIPHYRKSYIVSLGHGRTKINSNQEEYVYPKSYAVKDPVNPFNQLEFALKYDGINLEILAAVFKEVDPKDFETAVLKHPTSKYVRILWFLYEFLTETILNVPDAKRLQYIDVLDQEYYFTAKPSKSQRHCINNNLIGTTKFCPIIRKTKTLTDYIAKCYNEKVKVMAEKYDPQIIARASHYFYTKETLSSYEIEREKPSKERTVKFISLLRQAADIEVLTKQQLIELQNIIVDPRFQDADYRTQQNYVGENINQYLQRIHYIAPKPENVIDLMAGLLEALVQASESELHPVLVAAMIAFGFVFIHPFEDGNGRIHRFLIHYILAKEKFTPPGIIFPISAVMLQNMHAYDDVLESFSKPLAENITDYDLSPDGFLTVNQPTHNYYKYIDYTEMAEYLFKCIEYTMHEHFEKEIKFLINYDQTKHEIQAVVDMPDYLIDLFIKCVMQNHGKVGEQKKIKYFNKLSEQEISSLQEVVNINMQR